jgi:hypothetical protein
MSLDGEAADRRRKLTGAHEREKRCGEEQFAELRAFVEMMEAALGANAWPMLV